MELPPPPPFFLVKVVSKPAPSTGLWCYKDVVQAPAKDSTISSPEKAWATFGGSFVYPQEDGLLGQLGSPQEPLLGSEWGIDGKKKLPVPDFPPLLPVCADGLQTKTSTARMWTPLLLKLTLGSSLLLPGSQTCRMDQVCCSKSHLLWASPVPSNDNHL